MANNNKQLQRAKNQKCDEFYTYYQDIEAELQHYTKHFDGKTVLCNCDDPHFSNFAKFFLLNFQKFNLKRLICTSYNPNGKGFILDTDAKRLISELEGNGDFRSDECINYLKCADIIVSNPPFSLAKEYIQTISKYDKDFIFISNQTLTRNPFVFSLIKSNRLWTGANRVTRFESYYDKKQVDCGCVYWLTNLPHDKRWKIQPSASISQKHYPKYENYDAINIDKIKDLPADYDQKM